MRLTIPRAGALALLLATACSDTGVVDGAPASSPPEALQSFLESETESGRFSGVVLVRHGEETILEFAGGRANLELDAPMTPDARFKIHSTSKLVTATGVMRAVADGRLALDDSVCVHLQPCPPAWEPVSLRQLLNHSSGIPDATQILFDEWAGGVTATIEARYEDFAALEPAFEPGSDFRYSNFGPTLAGEILAAAYDTDLETALAELVFTPLDMTNTSLEAAPPADGYDGPVVEPGLASGYNGTAEQPIVAYSLMYVIPGGGGMISTADDLTKLLHAVFDPDAGFLPEELIAEMTSPGPIPQAGLGVFVRGEPVVCYLHTGGNNGYISIAAYYPREATSIVMLSNFGFLDLDVGALEDRLGLAPPEQE
ncbi:hypothetical protein DDZ18_12190 [Marinicauda salina]|uniref:Beta-lactamase-related domain-containing protein n=1 Tax=Marinicauda salina TaxID=2135793 RepID=A0A2U2BR85_9PROT|nr:serine hydrolase domain-containing protein [Marinicauda salina]PWE16522.1 hypothetical protein DDZ18_12190 [Marinicauda salina]